MTDSPGPAPALRRGLAVLRFLAERSGPVSAAAVARELGLPRSSVYELLGELAAAGFAVHLPDDRRWGLGPTAFEIGSAYLRAGPLERLGRPILARLARTTGGTAHLGILHGNQVMYLVRERATPGGAGLVDLGVRLPAALTATGLSLMAGLPHVQVRALYPNVDAFVLRTGRGCANSAQLRETLRRTRERGWAVEDGEVAPDSASVAAAVIDHNGLPTAAIGVTIAHRCPAPPDGPGCGEPFTELVAPVLAATAELTAAISGRRP